jgi:hypothetical protein
MYNVKAVEEDLYPVQIILFHRLKVRNLGGHSVQVVLDSFSRWPADVIRRRNLDIPNVLFDNAFIVAK